MAWIGVPQIGGQRIQSQVLQSPFTEYAARVRAEQASAPQAPTYPTTDFSKMMSGGGSAGTSTAPRPAFNFQDAYKRMGLTSPDASSSSTSSAPRPTGLSTQLGGDEFMAGLLRNLLGPSGTGASSGSSATRNPYADQALAYTQQSVGDQSVSYNQEVAGLETQAQEAREQAGSDPGVGGGVQNSRIEEIDRALANAKATAVERANQRRSGQAGQAGRTLFSAGESDRAFTANQASQGAAQQQAILGFLRSMLGDATQSQQFSESMGQRGREFDVGTGQRNVQLAQAQQQIEDAQRRGDWQQAFQIQQAMMQQEQNRYAAETAQSNRVSTGGYSIGGRPGMGAGQGGGGFNPGGGGGGGGGGTYQGLGGTTRSTSLGDRYASTPTTTAQRAGTRSIPRISTSTADILRRQGIG